MFGHLNNAVYYALFDTAINAWINTNCGIDPLTVPWLGVVAESGCRYSSELKFPEPLVVGLAVTRLGNSSVTYRLAVFEEPARPSPPSATGCTCTSTGPAVGRCRFRTPSARCWKRRAWRSRYARPMPLVSKTVEVAAPAESIMAIVADFELYPLWNEEIKGCWVLARYDDGRPEPAATRRRGAGPGRHVHHRRLLPGREPDLHRDAAGRVLPKQEQMFSVVAIGANHC